MLFLIQYNRTAGQIASMKSFEDGNRAAVSDARLALELELFRRGNEDEVVVLQAVNEEAIRRTHRRYFEDLESLTRPSVAVGESPQTE